MSSSAPKSTRGQNAPAAPCPKSIRSSKSSVISKSEEASPTGQKEQRTTVAHYGPQSHKAFTVFPPNPKKRKEIQKKAEAELAILEDLRLTRPAARVSINPSSVGGCLSLEEVRLKQQETQTRGRPRQVKR